LKVKTRGTVSNRNAIGSRITAVAGHSPQIREVNGGSSFLSMNSLDEILGFTHLTRVDQLNVRFPSGLEYEMVNLPVNQDVMVVEPVVSLSSSLKKNSVPRGSSFTVPVTIKNQTGTSQNIQVWWTAITPAGDEGVVKAPTAIATLSAHQSMTSNISLSIPATAPTGNYLFLVKTGTYPSALVHQYIFQVQVGP